MRQYTPSRELNQKIEKQKVLIHNLEDKHAALHIRYHSLWHNHENLKVLYAQAQEVIQSLLKKK